MHSMNIAGFYSRFDHTLTFTSDDMTTREENDFRKLFRTYNALLNLQRNGGPLSTVYK